MQDADVRSVLAKLKKESPHGQRHYLIKPGIHQIEENFWAEKKISAVDMTFEEFMLEIDTNVSSTDRLLSHVRPPSTHPIQSTFSQHVPPSVELIDFLTNKVEWVTNSIATSFGEKEDFFKGVDQEWFPILEATPIPRKLQNDIVELALQQSSAGRVGSAQFFIIKGEAGAGKTILMRQIAMETFSKSLGIALWVRDECDVDFDLIEELEKKSNERIYVFWDNAARNSLELYKFVTKSKSRDSNITVVSSERYNEWNVRCEELDELVDDKFELRYLSEKEIDLLVRKLEECNSLGPNLEHKSHEERCKELKEIHGRQLLVALHEATMGQPFEDIIYSEYQNILPVRAQKIYLTICTLYRMKSPVRAGLISRIHDICFEDFRREFFNPLEKVVILRGNTEQDYHYTARHSEIAEIVFKRALDDVQERHQEYISILRKFNLSFSTDRESFRHTIRAKSLLDLFPDVADVNAIYKVASDVVGDDPYLLQQMANYERLRPNGSLRRALELLERAKSYSPNDSSIVHSLSLVWRNIAQKEEDPYEIERCRAEAKGYLDLAESRWGLTSHISAVKIELLMDALSDFLLDSDSSEKSIRESIRRLQSSITENKRRFPTDGHVFRLETRFAELINDHQKALSALEKSFEENDREPSLAIRLASKYSNDGDISKAKDVLQKALDRRRSDHRLNFHYAELLRNEDSSHLEDLIYYYRRGFTPGDGNQQAQFWYARYAYNSDDTSAKRDSIDIFDNLRNARISHDRKVQIRDYDGGVTTPKLHAGRIVRKRTGFGFLSVNGTNDEIFFPENEVKENLWEAIREGDSVQFNIGYSFKGLVACNIVC